MKHFSLTQIQAQAILDMRLARLTALEIEALQKEYAFILETIRRLEAILASEAKLMRVIVHELTDIRDKYADKRRTRISETTPEIEIDASEFIQVEECVVLLTQSEFFKRLNQKSYQKSAMPGADGDIVQCIVPSATDRRIQIFTSAGNLYTVPASDIPECKLKDKGKPLSAILAGTDKNERIAGVFSVSDYNESAELFFVTKNGMLKRSKLSDYNVRNKKDRGVWIRRR